MQILPINRVDGISTKAKFRDMDPHTYFAKTLMQVDLDKACNLYYNSVKKHQEYKGPNFYLFGKIFHSHCLEMNDDIINTLEDLINRLLNLNQQNKNKTPLVEIINMIYSTMLKHITQQDIHKDRVSPQKYRKLVEDGKKMYYQFPTNNNIDYRHVLGRMNYLKQINLNYIDKIGKVPFQKNDIAWTLDDQLDYVGVLEKIVKEYDKVTESFNIPNDEYSDCIAETFSKKHSAELYESSLYITLSMINSNVKSSVNKLIALPKHQQTKDKILDIISNIESGYEYFDKISFDSPKIDKAWKQLKELRETEDLLQSKLTAKPTFQNSI